MRLTVIAVALVATGAIAAPTVALSADESVASQVELRKKAKKGPKTFLVCKRGCRYRTIQAGVNAAGRYQFKAKRKAVVKVRPGTYREGVLLHGKRPKHRFHGLTIIGVKKNGKPNRKATAVTLEGEGAKLNRKANDPYWTAEDDAVVPAGNGIEARSVNGVKIRNMYAKNYEANGFFVWADAKLPFERCVGFEMTNLWASDNRAYGMFARNCFGGKIVNGRGWDHGDSAYYIGETPCDKRDWSNRSTGTPPAPCQANPKWTLIKNVDSFRNVLGYSGTNAKYVRITKSRFYNNGAGIVPNTLDSEDFEPAGWSEFVDNDIFWNNYNYYRPDSAFETVSGGLGELIEGAPVNYPTGIGVILLGTDANVVRGNRIFGHAKWGSATFSAPVFGDLVEANEGDDAKNLNNQFIDNQLGWNGQYPNGFDFLNDATGGGNCWQGNDASGSSGGVTYVTGNGAVPFATLYPSCSNRQKALNTRTTPSINLIPVIQVDFSDGGGPALFNPETVMPGYYRRFEQLNRVAGPFQGRTYLTAQQVEDVVAWLATLREETVQ